MSSLVTHKCDNTSCLFRDLRTKRIEVSVEKS